VEVPSTHVITAAKELNINSGSLIEKKVDYLQSQVRFDTKINYIIDLVLNVISTLRRSCKMC